MLQTRRPALSGNALKGIAILAMTLDHLTWTLWPGYATDCTRVPCARPRDGADHVVFHR